MIIDQSNFNNHTWDIGGALWLTCPILFNQIACNFTNNHAFIKGGAIFYDSFIPGLTNLAPYGNDLASYPCKINMLDTSVYEINVASG